jgi:hypothetical protein
MTWLGSHMARITQPMPPGMQTCTDQERLFSVTNKEQPPPLKLSQIHFQLLLGDSEKPSNVLKDEQHLTHYSGHKLGPLCIMRCLTSGL